MVTRILPVAMATRKLLERIRLILTARLRMKNPRRYLWLLFYANAHHLGLLGEREREIISGESCSLIC